MGWWGRVVLQTCFGATAVEEPYVGAQMGTNNAIVKCFAGLDICTARYILQKQGESKEVFTCLRDIAARFVQEFLTAVPEATSEAFEALLEVRDGGDS